MIKLYIHNYRGIRPVLMSETEGLITSDQRIVAAVQRGHKSGSWFIMPSAALLQKMRYAGLHPALDEEIRVEIKPEHSESMREITGHSGLDA